MYQINKLNRPVLITPREVMFHLASDHDVDQRQLLQNIIVAEERLIAPALSDGLYYDFIAAKNVKVTSINQASLLIQVNAFLATEGEEPLTDLPIGTWVNAIELVTNPHYVELWEMFLWKLTAEAVDLLTTVPSWLRHTSQGQQKNNPDVIGGNGQGSASGDIKDVKFKMDIQMQDRIDPLITRMESWICKRKENYPLFDKPCPCDESETAVAYKRKTDIIFGIYDDDGTDCACAPINSNEYVPPAKTYHTIGDFANINSVVYLEGLAANFISYGYSFESFSFGLQNLLNDIPTPLDTYTIPDMIWIPTQAVGKKTIPQYQYDALVDPTGGLQLDNNWITFLKQLEDICPLKFYASPFDGIKDANYPVQVIESPSPAAGITPNNFTYGEGFTIEWPQGAEFEIVINCLYGDVEGHQIKFTHEGTWIDGAFVQSPQNLLTIEIL